MEPKRSNKTVFICQGTGCVSSRSPEIMDAIIKQVKKAGLKNIIVKKTGCHGFCQKGPIVIVNPEGIFYCEVKVEDAAEIVISHLKNNTPVERLFYKDPVTGKAIPYHKDIVFYKKQNRLILRNCGKIDPENIQDYISKGGYQALQKVLKKMTPAKVIQQIKSSGLRGRGGAGFPTGLKWEFCHLAEGDRKYMICNADEGDPGAFMDRSILEADPHAVLEGLVIGGYTIGAQEGYIYIRMEYPLAVQRFRQAIKDARARNFLGKNILGTKFSFNIHVKEGAGAFVCGEETALIASIEGKRGMPRPRPPYPAQSGLWGKPTTINNVKTLASVPVIIDKGAGWFKRIGTETCKGTAVFALTGKIANSGLVEVAMGTTLREIIYEIGGGIPDGKAFKAVQTGGPSGGCLPARFLDTPVDYESLKAAGSIMGSGGMVVMDEDTCIVDVAHYFLDFAQKESCGECVPCRLGVKQLLDILGDITEGNGKPGDLDLLVGLAESIKKSSLCGLGQTAPNPVLTTIKYFREEYEAHIKYKKCPAAVCKEIISSPCQHTCPIETEVPGYIALIARNRYQEAYAIIRKDNPLPSVCGRVCHHPCESKCQAGKWGDAIAIRTLKRFATDHAIKQGFYLDKKKPKLDKEKVAIIGAGPAGLAAGDSLADKGYKVTIFEALPVAGGGLAVCIPEYRLPRKILNIDIMNIKYNKGVEIKLNTRVGKDIAFNKLKKDHRAVFIAAGAHKSRTLQIPREGVPWVLDAMEFLKSVNLERNVKLGQTVGVIGGGNSAVDAARCALRAKGCEKVVIIYRRTRKEMPAFEEEIEAAIKEGIEIRYLTAPVEIVTDNGKNGIKCIKMGLGAPDDSGRRRPVPIKGSEFIIPLDNVIVAISEEPDVSFLSETKGLAISPRNTIEVDPETGATSLEGIFAGGDVVTGPNTVIEAIAAGKKAAIMIDKYLRNQDLTWEYKKTRPSIYISPVELTEEELEKARRPVVGVLPVHKRAKNFNEVNQTVSPSQAIQEARRCLRCDLQTQEGKQWLEQHQEKGER